MSLFEQSAALEPQKQSLAGGGEGRSASSGRQIPRGRFLAVGIGPVARKELADHLGSLRYAILLVLIVVASIAAMYAASGSIKEYASAEYDFPHAFLYLFTVSGENLPSMISFVIFLAPLLGIALGFDAVNSERSQGTLSRLMSQPIHRDAVLHGKFLAGVTVIALALAALLAVAVGIGIVLLGKAPSAEEIGRLIAFLVVTVIYVGFWLALAQLFSVVFKQAATSALASIAVWLFFAVFASLIVGLVTDAIAPAGKDATYAEVYRHEKLYNRLDRISPVTLYDEASTALLNPSVRSLGVLVLSQVDRALRSPLSFGQSILLVWPQVIALLGCVLVFFTLSYILFMKEEIRA